MEKQELILYKYQSSLSLQL